MPVVSSKTAEIVALGNRVNNPRPEVENFEDILVIPVVRFPTLYRSLLRNSSVSTTRENQLHVPASPIRNLTRQWNGRLASFRQHQNDEHLEALLGEALTYCGLHLENDLSTSTYWSKAPLARRVGVLLYLVDRGIVQRASKSGRVTYQPTDQAEAWAESQPSLANYLTPTLELITSLRTELTRRAR